MLDVLNMHLVSALYIVWVTNFAKCPTAETCIVDLMFLCFCFVLKK